MQKSEQNMDYEVILTIPAKTQLDHIIEYVLSKYGNTQAALSIMDDAEETKHRLSVYKTTWSTLMPFIMICRIMKVFLINLFNMIKLLSELHSYNTRIFLESIDFTFCKPAV